MLSFSLYFDTISSTDSACDVFSVSVPLLLPLQQPSSHQKGKECWNFARKFRVEIWGPFSLKPSRKWQLQTLEYFPRDRSARLRKTCFNTTGNTQKMKRQLVNKRLPYFRHDESAIKTIINLTLKVLTNAYNLLSSLYCLKNQKNGSYGFLKRDYNQVQSTEPCWSCRHKNASVLTLKLSKSIQEISIIEWLYQQLLSIVYFIRFSDIS